MNFTPTSRGFWKWENIALSLIMLCGAFLRFYHYADWSLSNDELSALNRLRFDSFSEMISQGVKHGDFHPAGVQTLLWFWIKLFGDSEWAIRLPFVIFGTLSLGWVYLIGKKWFGVPTALFATAAMVFLQYPILYSQLARPYAPGLFFSLASVWFWTKIIFDKKRPLIDYAGFSVFAALCAYSHHYSFLFVIVVGISGFLFFRQLDLKKYLLAAVVSGLLYLPHLGIFLHQFGIGGVGGEDGWLSVPQPNWILHYLWYAFNESYLVISVLLSIFTFSLFRFKTKISKFHWLSISWFLIMFLIAYLYSIWRNPILQFSILIFSFPFLLLFIFSFLNKIVSKKTALIVLVFLAFGITQTTWLNKFYQQQHFGEFKGIAEKISEWNTTLGKENVANTVVVNGPYYLHYYLDRMADDISIQQYDNIGGKDILELKHILDAAQTDYFIHAWTKVEPNEIDLLIRKKYPCIVESINYQGLAEFTLFSKTPNDSCKTIKEAVYTFNRNYDEQEQKSQYGKKLDTTHFVSRPNSFKIDSLSIYAPGLKTSIHKINQGEFKRIEVELAAFSQEEIKNAVIVISIKNNGKEYFWRGSQIQNFVLPGTWGKGFLSFELPEIKNPDDILNIYVWNSGKSKVLIDDFEIRFYSE